MLSGARHGDGEIGVERGWCTDEHGVDVMARDEILGALVHRHPAQAMRPPARLRIRIGRGDERGALHAAELAKMRPVGDHAATDDAEADRTSRHARLRTPRR